MAGDPTRLRSPATFMKSTEGELVYAGSLDTGVDTHAHTHTHTPPTKTCVASVLPARKEAPPSPERGLCEAHVRAKGIDEHERDETGKRV